MEISSFRPPSMAAITAPATVAVCSTGPRKDEGVEMDWNSGVAIWPGVKSTVLMAE